MLLHLMPSLNPPLYSCAKNRLRRGPDLGQRLAFLESLLLLESHDLEAVEVRQGLPPLDLIALLCPVAGLPFGVDLRLLPLLEERAVTRASVQALDDHLGEKDLGEGEGLPGDDKLGV